MKVFILTEGGGRSGFGHVTRCSAIYDAFKNREITPCLFINADESVKRLLKDRRYRLFDWLKRREELFADIKDADVVIVDSYLAGRSFYEKISRSAKRPVYLDDNRRISYPDGIVVNGSIYAEDLRYPRKNGVRYLVGVKYAPLRREFWSVPKRNVGKEARSIMVTFGGDDSRNMTAKVLKFLTGNYPDLTKWVIVGRGFKYISGIEKARDGRTALIHNADAAGMKEAMLASDIAVSAGGQTLYELARIGTPAIAICIADNQRRNVKGWRDAGFVEYIGSQDENNLDERLAEALKSLNYRERLKRARIGRTLVDGRGALRMIAEILRGSKYEEE